MTPSLIMLHRKRRREAEAEELGKKGDDAGRDAKLAEGEFGFETRARRDKEAASLLYGTEQEKKQKEAFQKEEKEAALKEEKKKKKKTILGED